MHSLARTGAIAPADARSPRCRGRPAHPQARSCRRCIGAFPDLWQRMLRRDNGMHRRWNRLSRFRRCRRFRFWRQPIRRAGKSRRCFRSVRRQQFSRSDGRRSARNGKDHGHSRRRGRNSAVSLCRDRPQRHAGGRGLCRRAGKTLAAWRAVAWRRPCGKQALHRRRARQAAVAQYSLFAGRCAGFAGDSTGTPVDDRYMDGGRSRAGVFAPHVEPSGESASAVRPSLIRAAIAAVSCRAEPDALWRTSRRHVRPRAGACSGQADGDELAFAGRRR